MKFEWDNKKATSNLKKHKISFEDALSVFSDPFSLNKQDNENSQNEDRWIILGKTKNNLIVVMAHTYRGFDKFEIVRIISARLATKNEKNHYYQRCKK